MTAGEGILRVATRALVVLLVLAVCPAFAATVNYVYDALGRLVAQVDSQGATIYTYDAAGNLTSVSRNAADQLSIVSFSPTRAKIGDAVTILGSGFFADPAQNTVSFNGAPGTVTSAAATVLVVTVPADATSGPITVTNARGTVTSPQPFTLVTPATIAAVTPSFVSRGATTQIAISGTGLGSATRISFSEPGLSAAIVSATEAHLTADLTVQGTVAFGTYTFSVTNEAGATASGSVTITVSPAILGDAQSLSRPASVHLRALIPGAPAGNSMSATGPVSVHLQAAVPGAPAGNAMSATGPVSVHLQAPVPGAPAGNSMSATGAVSVHLQAPVPGAPAGNSMSVTEPVSVSVP